MDTSKQSSHILADQDPDEVLYSDKYFIVTKTELIIKCYYFPFCTSKVIPLKEIVSIHTDKELGFKWYDRKSWGMQLNNVWYAMDWKRQFRHDSCIIEVADDCIRKGFTVIDENALEILKKVWNDALTS